MHKNADINNNNGCITTDEYIRHTDRWYNIRMIDQYFFLCKGRLHDKNDCNIEIHD